MINKSTFLKLPILVILVPIGLLTKLYSGLGREFINNYLGGVFYVIFFIVLTSLIFPKTTLLKISLIIFCITCLLEFSQLIQISFLNSLREYFIIRALIGSVFNVFDFIFYFIGALIGFATLTLINKILTNKNKNLFESKAFSEEKHKTHKQEWH